MPLKAGCIKDTGIPMGRGVFALRQIEDGELIEICPVVKVISPYQSLSSEVKNIVFDWNQLAQQIGIKAIALGYGSLYNHANPANATYRADEAGELLVISAARVIKVNEQITINYNFSGGGTLSSEDNWFKQRNIEVLSDTE